MLLSENSSHIFEEERKALAQKTSQAPTAVVIILPSVYDRLSGETMQIDSKSNINGCGINYVK